MSSAPTGISAPSFSAIASAMRRASGTPRRWMPTRARPEVPACFSTISWLMRIVARRISSAVMMWRALIAPSRPLGACGAASRGRLEGTLEGYRARSRRMREHEPNTDHLGGLPSHMLTLGYKASAEQFGPRDLLAFAIHAERAGFESVFVSDHFQPWRNTDGHAPNCLVWLGALAMRTQKVTIGTSVLTPSFRYHPAVVAQ